MHGLPRACRGSSNSIPAAGATLQKQEPSDERDGIIISRSEMRTLRYEASTRLIHNAMRDPGEEAQSAQKSDNAWRQRIE